MTVTHLADDKVKTVITCYVAVLFSYWDVYPPSMSYKFPIVFRKTKFGGVDEVQIVWRTVSLTP